jgi:hypothetical protein
VLYYEVSMREIEGYAVRREPTDICANIQTNITNRAPVFFCF